MYINANGARRTKRRVCEGGAGGDSVPGCAPLRRAFERDHRPLDFGSLGSGGGPNGVGFRVRKASTLRVGSNSLYADGFGLQTRALERPVSGCKSPPLGWSQPIGWHTRCRGAD